MMDSAALVIDLDTGRRWSVNTAETSIGRGGDNEIVIPGMGVSRFQAVLDWSPPDHTIRDAGSRNGTFLNGVEVGSDPRRLVDGDLIVLAGSVSLRYLNSNATPAVPRLGRLMGVWIDDTSGDVWVDARRIEPALSPHQQALLQLLVDADGAVVSRMTVVAEVWSDVDGEGVSDDAVTALAKRLRGRLLETSPDSDYVEVVRGRGFRLCHGDEG